MERLTEVIIGLFDLAEAEGRLIQQKIILTIVVVLMYVVAVLFFVLAGGFLLVAVYYVLSLYFQKPVVFIIMGGVCVFLSGITIWRARYLNQRR